jgi:hypothetical protein
VSGDGVGLSVVQLAALLTGAVLTLGIAVLLVAVLAVRRRRDPHHHHHHHGAPHQMELEAVKQQKVLPSGGPLSASRHSSLLEINHGEHRYVVSYTLKSAAECGQQLQQQQTSERQPDILNTPRGKWRSEENRPGERSKRDNYLALGNGPLHWFLYADTPVPFIFSYKVITFEMSSYELDHSSSQFSYQPYFNYYNISK